MVYRVAKRWMSSNHMRQSTKSLSVFSRSTVRPFCSFDDAQDRCTQGRLSSLLRPKQGATQGKQDRRDRRFCKSAGQGSPLRGRCFSGFLTFVRNDKGRGNNQENIEQGTAEVHNRDEGWQKNRISDLRFEKVGKANLA